MSRAGAVPAPIWLIQASVESTAAKRGGTADAVGIGHRAGRIAQELDVEPHVQRMDDRRHVAVVRHVAGNGDRLDAVGPQPQLEVRAGEGARQRLVHFVVAPARGDHRVVLRSVRAGAKKARRGRSEVGDHHHLDARRACRIHRPRHRAHALGKGRVLDRHVAAVIVVLYVDHDQRALSAPGQLGTMTRSAPAKPLRSWGAMSTPATW